MCLYDLTSTYFEGTEVQGGGCGHSRDKRWDRYQIVIGLVCDEAGVPLAIEVSPGNTADKTTVVELILYLKDRFKIHTAIFVGDAGMYTQTNVEAWKPWRMPALTTSCGWTGRPSAVSWRPLPLSN